MGDTVNPHPRGESHVAGTSRQVNRTTGEESAHEFERRVTDAKVTHELRSLIVPDLAQSAESRSPEAIRYFRELEDARKHLMYREKRATGGFAVPKPGAKVSPKPKADPVPIVCPDCEGWGIMENELGNQVQCPRCEGRRWILKS